MNKAQYYLKQLVEYIHYLLDWPMFHKNLLFTLVKSSKLEKWPINKCMAFPRIDQPHAIMAHGDKNRRYAGSALASLEIRSRNSSLMRFGVFSISP